MTQRGDGTEHSIVVEPWDEHNQALVRNVHPGDWVNPEPAARYNLVVIGAGTAGLVTAAGAAGLGAKVALVERDLMGGDCLNVGCVPSKALIRAARAWADVRDAGAFGVEVAAGTRVNFPAVMERMRRLRAQISRNDSVWRFRDLGVDVFLGEGRFSGPDTVEVAGKTLRFKKAVIATGARAAAPPIPGLAEAGYLTNETVFSLTELPRPLGSDRRRADRVRAGAGLRAIWKPGVPDRGPARHPAQRGSRRRGDRPPVALIRDGVTLLCCGGDLKVVKDAEGKRLTVDSHGQRYDIPVDEILVGVGRRPNIEGLGLDRVGVAVEKTGVKVNDRLQTTNPRIYAAGDVCSPYKFTHNSDFQARIVIQNALFLGRAKASALTIPWCTYTDPEIAHVGLYEREAQARGIRCGRSSRNSRTWTGRFWTARRRASSRSTSGRGRTRSWGRRSSRGTPGEMLPELTLAMTQGLGLGKIATTIHTYPTQAEAIRKLGDQYNRTRLTPFLKKAFDKWLTWTR